MEFIASLFTSITGSFINMIVYALIATVFILGLIKCVFPVVHTRALLRGAIGHIRAGAGAKKSWQEDDFLGNGSLAAHWSEYLNNLFFADGVYHNASNVEDFINEDTVIYGPGRSMFADAIPGILVSLGFLGTLIGLAQGLAGFSIEDSDAVLGSITTLIPGMQTAFFTSIVGVICSVAFTLITRAVNGSTEHTLRSFYGAMSRYAGVLSVDPMTQVAIYQQEQTALIRKMANDIGGSLAGNLTKALEPLNQTMRDFVSVSTKEQMRFLDTVVGRFTERMDTVLSGQLTRLSKVLSETADYQKSALGTVRTTLNDTSDMLGSIREVARTADDMVRGNAAYIDSLRESQRKASDMFDSVSSAVEQMDLVSRRQADYLNTISAMHADILRSSDQIAKSMDNLSRTLNGDAIAAADEMHRTVSDLRAAGQDVQRAFRECTDGINRELQLTLDDYTEFVNKFSAYVGDTTTAITQSVDRLPGAVSAASDRFLDQVDRLTDAVAQARMSVGSASRTYDDRARR